MSDIIYHKATLIDIETIINMRVEFLFEHFNETAENEINSLRNEMRSFLSINLPSQNVIAYLALVDDNAVAAGMAFLYTKPGNFKNPSGKNAYIMSMYTKAAYRKKGIASAILSHLENDALELGYHFMELHATEDGEPVYQKAGYRLHKEPTYRKTLEH